MRELAQDAGLATTRVEISAECERTEATVQRLLRAERSLLAAFLCRTYFYAGRESCDFDALPDRCREAAECIGFRPLIWVAHGPAIPSVKSAQFIGPEGFVKLEVFSGQRVYLSTYFDDGTAVDTAARYSGGVFMTLMFLAPIVALALLVWLWLTGNR